MKMDIIKKLNDNNFEIPISVKKNIVIFSDASEELFQIFNKYSELLVNEIDESNTKKSMENDILKNLRDAFKIAKKSAIDLEENWINSLTPHGISVEKAREICRGSRPETLMIISYTSHVLSHINFCFPKLRDIMACRKILKEIKSDLVEIREYFNISFIDICNKIAQIEE